MNEFQQELLKTLKGIQRELVIQNTKVEDKDFQREIFELNDHLALMVPKITSMDKDDPLYDDLLNAYKKKMKELNMKIFVGGVDI